MEGRRRKGEITRNKSQYVRVIISHNEYIHFVSQKYTNNFKKQHIYRSENLK